MLQLSHSVLRKLLATVLAASAFILLYNATVIDTHSAGLVDASKARGTALIGSHLSLTGTAYCKGHITSAGVNPQAGIAAADPHLLPEGSVIQLEGVPDRYRGIYTVMDTGPAVQGLHVDLYMWSCIEALTFGRRSIELTVLRHGWNPVNSAPIPAKRQSDPRVGPAERR